jgi:FkbM family methyltransferase
MSDLKTTIKKAAQSFGLDITRYPRPLQNLEDTQVARHWGMQLVSGGPVRVVFDIGSNVGDSVAAFRSAFPGSDVYAFEPSPTVFSKLQERMRNEPQVKLVQAAVGEHDGTASLHQNSADDSNSMLANSSRIYEFAPIEMCEPVRDIEVPITRIDSFCAKHSISQIDLLKVDSQGYERQILAGAGDLLAPKFIRGLFLEILFVDLWDNQSWCGEVLELMRARGYRLFGITNVAYDDVNGWKWADALFLSNQPRGR